MRWGEPHLSGVVASGRGARLCPDSRRRAAGRRSRRTVIQLRRYALPDVRLPPCRRYLAPLNVALGPDDLHYSAAAAQAKMLVVSREMARRNAAGLGALSATMPILQLEEMGEPDHPWLRMLRRDAAPSDHPAHSWSTREACWIIFSGATTGRPKAIVLPHSHGVACGQRSIEALDLGVGDAFYSVLQMCHGWLLFHIITPALLTGIPCAATRWFSASRWLADVRRLGATIVDPFLPMIGAIMAQPERADDGDNPARACIGALGSVSEGARPRLDAFEKRFGLKTLNGYGSTELGGLTSRENSDRQPAWHLGATSSAL